MSLDEFYELPWKTAHEYLKYLELTNREENERAKRSNRGPGR